MWAYMLHVLCVVIWLALPRQLPKMSAGIDASLQQKIMDMHRRNVEDVDAQMQHQKDRALAELQVCVMSMYSL